MTVDSVTAACRDLAHDHLNQLCPDGTVQVVTDEAVERHAKRDWVTGILHVREQETELRTDTVGIPAASLPCKRRDVAIEHLSKFGTKGLVPVTRNTAIKAAAQGVTHDLTAQAAGHGWALRALELRERTALEKVRQKNMEAQNLSTFMSRTRTLPADKQSHGHGGWYECEMPCDVAHVIALAQHHPDDVRAQETACQVIANTASVPQHLEVPRAKVVVAAMYNHKTSRRLQWRASQALLHITGNAVSARVAQAVGAVTVLVSAGLQFPVDKALQEATLAALANIAKYREKVTLGFGLRETIDVAKSAMSNHPREPGIQAYACMLLWNLATEEPGLLATHSGLKNLVEHAACQGVKEAPWLLECVQWRSVAEVHIARGGGRKRWGQWATGRQVAA